MSLSSSRKRIQKLEARFVDESGLILYSPAWVDYWTREIESIIASKDVPRRQMTFEAACYYLRKQRERSGSDSRLE